ncbi:hypothetical protein SAMN05414137_12194 [Streptacidiphilus jiangxiensis]|uniref:Uncharacterized protein n=2 Tax=Streptacidiphilus jiangxiensis TaxID=235985 RepID=A0A1H7WRV8_STRJI|nr:hypothetical protein SAMN05414137_12194 [Streptacidiphilus jiangxiensis]
MTGGGAWPETTREEAAPGALESAMRIPGAVAAAFGDLGSGRVLGTTSRPAQTGGVPVPLGKVALGIAMGAIADFAGTTSIDSTAEGGEAEQAVEEVIITGRRYFCLWQAARMRSGDWHAFIQISLDRTKANLAMARLDLRAVAECLPGAVEYHRRFDLDADGPSGGRHARPAPAPEPEPPPLEDGEDLPRRDPGRQIPGAVPPAPAAAVSESILRQILWGLKRYR